MKFIHQNIIKYILSAQLTKSGGKVAVAIYFLLNFFVAVAMVISILQGDSKHVLACIKIFILFLIPWVIEWIFKIELPTLFVIIVQVFIYAAIILGELDSYYLKYPNWDTILHTINGFLCASVGFMIVNLIFEQKLSNKVVINPINVVIFAFCLSMTAGVLWEFYEFGMDNICNRDMQKDTIIHTIKSAKLNQEDYSLTVLKDVTNVTLNGEDYNLGGYLDIGLYDTMGDLFNNFIGTLVFCVMGYFVTKNESQYKMLRCLIYCSSKKNEQPSEYNKLLTET